MPKFLYIYDKGSTQQSVINTQIGNILGRPINRNGCDDYHYDASSGTFDGTSSTINPPHRNLEDFDVVFHINPDPSQNAPTNDLSVPAQQALADYVKNGGVFVGTSYLGKYSTNYTSVQTDFSDNLILFDNTGDASNYVNTSTSIYDMSFGGNNGITDPVLSKYLTCKSDIRLASMNDVSTNGYTASRNNITNIHMYYGAGVKAGVSTLAWFYSSQMRTAGINTPLEYIVAKRYGSGVAINLNQILNYATLTVGNFSGSSQFFGSFLLESGRNWFLQQFSKNVYCTLDCYSNICFVAGTMVNTDQGQVEIQNIVPGEYTINNKKIINITKTFMTDDKLVHFKKGSIGKNIPNKDTIMSGFHQIKYKTKPIYAYKLANMLNNVKFIKYEGQPLYNIMMEDWEFINVQNLTVETLHPDNIIYKLYKNTSLSGVQRNLIIAEINKATFDEDQNKINEIKKLL